MTQWTDRDWQAYYLTHPDHRGLSLEEAAEEMGLPPQELKYILYSLRAREPSLFTDISSDGHRPGYGVVQYGGWCDTHIKNRF